MADKLAKARTLFTLSTLNYQEWQEHIVATCILLLKYRIKKIEILNDLFLLCYCDCNGNVKVTEVIRKGCSQWKVFSVSLIVYLPTSFFFFFWKDRQSNHSLYFFTSIRSSVVFLFLLFFVLLKKHKIASTSLLHSS